MGNKANRNHLPGELVVLYNGKSARRYYCANPGCPATLSVSKREQAESAECVDCLKHGLGWWNVSLMKRQMMIRRIPAPDLAVKEVSATMRVDESTQSVPATEPTGKNQVLQPVTRALF